MPHTVTQIQGHHKTTIDRIVAAYKAGQVTEREAWERLSILYHRCMHWPPPVLEEHSHDRQYMIDTWFPCYGNLWYEGKREDCHRQARILEREHGGEFQVVYEY